MYKDRQVDESYFVNKKKKISQFQKLKICLINLTYRFYNWPSIALKCYTLYFFLTVTVTFVNVTEYIYSIFEKYFAIPQLYCISKSVYITSYSLKGKDSDVNCESILIDKLEINYNFTWGQRSKQWQWHYVVIFFLSLYIT